VLRPSARAELIGLHQIGRRGDLPAGCEQLSLGADEVGLEVAQFVRLRLSLRVRARVDDLLVPLGGLVE